MTHYWDTLLETEREGYKIILDKTWEDIDPADLMDTSIDPDTGKPYFDMDEIYSDINNGNLDWFMLRARVFVEDLEIAREIVGGFLYKDAREVLTDGVADDMIYEALTQAKSRVYNLANTFTELSHQQDRELA